jgi:hypothetical protein
VGVAKLSMQPLLPVVHSTAAYTWQFAFTITAAGVIIICTNLSQSQQALLLTAVQ